MNNDCPRAGRWVGGCKFEPRHDWIPPEPYVDILGPHYQPIAEIEARTRRIYVCDVCIRCGKTIERSKD